MSAIKELLTTARTEIADTYESEAIDIRLEEFDRGSGRIIISFLLPDKNPGTSFAAVAMGTKKYERIYKCVGFDKNGNIQSVKMYKKQ